ncbi:hypothetical protein H8959_006983 [Pygathrix nigripes]
MESSWSGERSARHCQSCSQKLPDSLWPYHSEHSQSRLISEAKQCRAWYLNGGPCLGILSAIGLNTCIYSLLALEKYEEMFPAFTDSRECKLLKKLLEAHEEQNSEAYTEAVKEFDSISRLDQWLTTMLLRIKKSIQGDGEGDGDLK